MHFTSVIALKKDSLHVLQRNVRISVNLRSPKLLSICIGVNLLLFRVGHQQIAQMCPYKHWGILVAMFELLDEFRNRWGSLFWRAGWMDHFKTVSLDVRKLACMRESFTRNKAERKHLGTVMHIFETRDLLSNIYELASINRLQKKLRAD